MTDMARLLLMLGLAGTAVTFLGSASLWFFNEPKRIRRALRRVLKADPESVIVAQGRGRGAGFSFSTGLAAVAWDKGAWCLVYRLDEIMGAELTVDGQVLARVYRGEPRRALEQTVSSASQVTFRLIMSDPRYPDFDLDLWLVEDENRRDDWSPREAIQEGNRWLARIDAIVRRPLAPRAPAVERAPVVAAPPSPPPAQPPAPRRREPEPRIAPEIEQEFEQELEVEPEPAPAPRFKAPRPAARPVVEEQASLPWDDGDDGGPPWDDEDEDTRA